MQKIENGITDAFDDNNMDVSVSSYILDTKFTSLSTQKINLNNLLDSLSGNPPDLIITTYDEAIYSLLDTEHELTHSTPIVFTGVRYLNYELIGKHNHKNVTGTTNHPDFVKCYKLAQQLLGKIDEIQIIGEESYAGKSAIEDAKKQLKKIPNAVFRENSSNIEVNAKEDVIDSTKKDSLYIVIKNIDKLNGLQLMESMTYQPNSFCIMAKWNYVYSDLPLMGTAPFLMVSNEGFGTIGGYITRGYDNGYAAGTIASHILTGTSVSSIPIQNSKQKPVFDWVQLKRWNIPLEKLPADSEVLNMPLTVRYKELFIFIIVFSCIFLISLISWLVYILKKERKQKKLAQNLLLNKREELDVTMKSIRESVISIDKNHRIFAINNAAMESLKLNKEMQEYIGADILSIFNITLLNNNDYLKDIFQLITKSAHTIAFEKGAAVVTPDNLSFLIAGSITPLQTKEIDSGWVITFNNITSEFIKKELHTLAMGEGNVYAWRYNGKKEVYVFEEVFFRETGFYDKGNHCIHLENFERLIHPEDFDTWNKQLKEVVDRKKDKVTIQVRFNVNGNYEWWSYTVTSINNPTLTSSFTLFGLCMSIQSFKETEESLRIARDKAEESDKLKSIFLSNMSHEIRTPLNSIVGFSNLLTADDNFSPEEKSIFVSTINEKCDLLLNLINDILDLSRIESGLPFNPEKCDVNLIIEELISSEKCNLKPTVKLIKDLPPKPIYIQADIIRLRQIIHHLLSNSIKFTTEGYIEIGSRIENNAELIIYVKDTGMGISQTEIVKIFDRFYKSDNFSQGGGLGLSISKVIVERMGGNIKAESNIGEGSSFTISLPYNNCDEELFDL